MTKKYEDDSGEGGWVSAGDEVKATKVEAAALSADEVAAAEAEEVRGKEKVRDKVARLLGQLRGGQVFGAAKKALFEELEELVRGLKGEETVAEAEKLAKSDQAKAGSAKVA